MAYFTTCVSASYIGRHGKLMQIGDVAVRIFVGGLTFLLALAFAICLIGSLILNSWYAFPAQQTALGFFGFGIPLILVGVATAFLWARHNALLKFLGWASTIAGVVCGIAILLLVARRVFLDAHTLTDATWPLIWRVLAFGVVGVVVGGFGIAVLSESDSETVPHRRPEAY